MTRMYCVTEFWYWLYCIDQFHIQLDLVWTMGLWNVNDVECIRQSGIGAGLSLRTVVFLCQYHSIIAIYLYSIHLPLTPMFTGKNIIKKKTMSLTLVIIADNVTGYFWIQIMRHFSTPIHFVYSNKSCNILLHITGSWCLQISFVCNTSHIF